MLLEEKSLGGVTQTHPRPPQTLLLNSYYSGSLRKVPAGTTFLAIEISPAIGSVLAFAEITEGISRSAVRCALHTQPCQISVHLPTKNC